jgi:hypothetical protein
MGRTNFLFLGGDHKEGGPHTHMRPLRQHYKYLRRVCLLLCNYVSIYNASNQRSPSFLKKRGLHLGQYEATNATLGMSVQPHTWESWLGGAYTYVSPTLDLTEEEENTS